jgi:glycosyltransferase involved in cell wall biosynthesis
VAERDSGRAAELTVRSLEEFIALLEALFESQSGGGNDVVRTPRIALALEYPLGQQGGTEVLVQELVRGLSPHFEIILVSGDESPQALPLEISRLISAHLRWDVDAGSAKAGRGLATALQQERIQLAHFHFGGTFVWQSNRVWRCPIYYLAASGVPCLATNHLATEWLGYGIDPSRPLWQKELLQVFALLSRALLYQRLKVEVCVSKADRARVVRMFPLFEDKIIQRYHSLLCADAPPPDLKERERVVLCVGTIGGRKAQPLLAEAFARVAARQPEWRLEFIGRTGVSSDEEQIRACAARHSLGDRIRVLGRLEDGETIGRMKRASIFALPSLQEGLGLSLQEALFHGCVGLGTRAGGIPELIDHESNGLLVPAGDVQALAQALDRLMSDPGLLEKYRSQSRLSILRKGMTAKAMVQTYLELYSHWLPIGA